MVEPLRAELFSDKTCGQRFVDCRDIGNAHRLQEAAEPSRVEPGST